MAERWVPVDVVEAWIWDRRAGVVALDPRLGCYAFAWDPVYARDGDELAPLHMPLRTDRSPYVFPSLSPDTWRRLPALLADALPDDFGNALVNRWLAARGIDAPRITPLDRLAYQGQRGMGALTFRPSRGPRTTKASAVELSSLVTAARAAVHGQVEDDEDETIVALRALIEVGTSAGGARAKAVVAFHPDTHELRSGQVAAPPGFQHWLLKFDGMGRDHELGASQQYGRIELAYHHMAVAAGIDMMPCRLLEEHGRAHFMTRRFDREPDGTRHHVLTLCGMDHLDFRLRGAHSYEQLLLVARRLRLPREAEVEILRRLVFNVVARNCDDHTKNVSFLLRRGQPWSLAPAYDVTFAHNPDGVWTHQHLMSVSGKFRGHTPDDVGALADRFGLGEWRRIVREVLDAVSGWPEHAAAAQVDEAEAARIGALHLRWSV